MRVNPKILLRLSVLIVSAWGMGCKRNSGPDPANANLAPVDQNAASQVGPEDQYGQPLGAAENCAQEPQRCNEPLTVAHHPPPPLPRYRQPPCPGENYIWTPGYWGYTVAGYYWVPGAWVLAPYVYALWTPPYWDFYGGSYYWHAGFWGPHIGFYGGINYGFGYTGLGFYGGYWNNGVFFYNRAVTNVSIDIVHNTYRYSVTNYTPFNSISYNGGPGGISRQPGPAELAARRDSRVAPLPSQLAHMRNAGSMREQFASENRGQPRLAALDRPLATAHTAPAPAPRDWHGRGNEAPRNTPTAAPRPEARMPERGEARSAPMPHGSADRRETIEPHLAAPVPREAHPRGLEQRGSEPRAVPQGRQNEIQPRSMPHMTAPPERPQGPPQQHAQHAAPVPQQERQGPQPHMESHQPQGQSRPSPPSQPQGGRNDHGRGGR